MPGQRRTPVRIRSRWSGLGLLVLAIAGCSTTPGGGFSIFPEGHKLSQSAKELRAAAPFAQPLPRELNKQVLPPYVVEPGDVLLVQAEDLDSPVRFPGDQPILPDGTINLGRYGRLTVAGKTVDEIEGAVRTLVEAHHREKDAKIGPITVRIVTRISKVYYVLGAVNAPGAFQLNGRETALDGIVAAGGLTDSASRQKIILSRPTRPDGCRVVLPICYNDIVQVGDTSTNYQLAPGDRIFVASRTIWEELFHFLIKEEPPCGGPQTPCPGLLWCDPAVSPVFEPAGHPIAPLEIAPTPAPVITPPSTGVVIPRGPSR